jgi:hypothetical protein
MPLIKGLQDKIEAVLVQMQELLHLWRERMKNLRLLCATIVLTLAFAISAYADDGHISCPAVTAPPPPPVASALGEMLMPIVDAVIIALSLS